MNSYLICSIIVCYEPDDNIYVLIKKLVQQNVIPIIIDNSSRNYFNLDLALGNIRYIKVGFNSGISYAQNLGIDEAIRLNADIVLFLDQDSQLSDNLIESLLQPIRNDETNITVPIYKDSRYNFFYKMVNINSYGIRTTIKPFPNMGNFFINNSISSGTMITRSALLEIGKMDGNLFIDYVDTEWFLRANNLGKRALVVTNAVMEHSIGDEIINLGFIKIPIHSPLRRYYRVRNAIKLFFYPHIPKLLALREFVFAIVHQLIIISCCDKKLDYIYYFFKAIKDGFLNKQGKME